MRPGFKIFLALLILAVLAMVFVPPLLGLFFGGGFDP